MLDLDTPVADLVLQHSECAEVFHRHRIDFCCRGEMSVSAAAVAKGVDPAALSGELTRAIERHASEPRAELRGLSTPDLVDHIVRQHHAYTKSALPFIDGLAAKVARVHGDHNPRLRAMAMAVAELTRTLLPHLEDEERDLFPRLTATAVDRDGAARALAAMKEEHHGVAALLERIREASEHYALPDWACNSYRTLFAEMERLERDIHVHVHLENHLLEPRFSGAAAAS